MNKKWIGISLSLFLVSGVFGQDFFESQRKDWLKKAEAFKPKLIERIVKPIQIVNMVADPNVFQGWKATPASSLKDFHETSFKKQSGTVFDFGEHLTGHFSFKLKALRGIPDGPIRVKLTFGEVPAEVMTPFDPYSGALSRAWLQD